MQHLNLWDTIRDFCTRSSDDRPSPTLPNPQIWLTLKQTIGLVVAVLYFVLALPITQPAIASVHAYPQGEEQTMFRSLQSLRDQANRSWQLVFFDQVDRGEIKLIHLRIVGFPGLELARSPLTLTARTGQNWIVPDVAATEQKTGDLPPNAGEFDLIAVMRDLQDDSVIDLGLELVGGDRVELTVPVSVVREWRSVLEQR